FCSMSMSVYSLKISSATASGPSASASASNAGSRMVSSPGKLRPGMVAAALPPEKPGSGRQAAHALLKRFRTAANAHGLQPGGIARDDLDVARRNAKRRGDQLDQRLVGLALFRHRPHPRLEMRTSVGRGLDAFDRIARRFWRQADEKLEPARNSPVEGRLLVHTN